MRLHVVTDPDRLYCGHMTVYPNGRKERLHGHNFRVYLSIDLADGSFAAMVDLDVARHALDAICAQWKERLLLAQRCPFLEIVKNDTELEFRLCGERYVVPRGEVVLLPIENASVEGLAEHIGHLLREPLASLPPVTGYEVRLEELPGIGASEYVKLDRALREV
jgi:6-pyruvoyltetrahydropterin/6-carboxytetrahydropterin synthase